MSFLNAAIPPQSSASGIWDITPGSARQRAPLSLSSAIHAFRPRSAPHSSHIEPRFDLKTFRLSVFAILRPNHKGLSYDLCVDSNRTRFMKISSSIRGFHKILSNITSIQENRNHTSRDSWPIFPLESGKLSLDFTATRYTSDFTGQASASTKMFSKSDSLTKYQRNRPNFYSGVSIKQQNQQCPGDRVSNSSICIRKFIMIWWK